MTLNDALKQLKALGDEKMRGAQHQGRCRRQAVRRQARGHPGPGEEDQGRTTTGPGPVGDRKHRRPVPGHPSGRARDLSATESGTTGEVHRLWAGGGLAQLYVVKEHPDKEALRKEWMTSADPWAAGPDGTLTAGRVVKGPDGLDLAALLDRIETEMARPPPRCSGR